MIRENSSTLLIRLARSSGKIIKSMMEKKRIRKVRVPYLKEKLTKFKHKDGTLSFQSTTKQVIREEWNWIDLFKHFDPEVKKTDEFSNAVEQLSSILKANKSHAEFWISRFLRLIGRATLNGATDDRIVELTMMFIRELEGSPRLWTPLIWLKGIWISDDPLELSNDVNMIFRKPVPSDIEREWNLQMGPYFMEGWSRDQPTSILELSLRARNQPDVSRELTRLLLTLRLFKVGSVTNIRTFWRSESILQMGGTTFKTGLTPMPYKYSLSKTNIQQFESFIKRISPLIPKSLIESGSDQIDYSVIAIQRYNDAILKPEIIESRLSFAVMSLESLYLKEMERQELKHRLGQRVALLLSLFGHDPLKVYSLLTRSYDIRSSFVHGSPIPKEKSQEASKLAEKLVEYARFSIVLFLQLKAHCEKDKFLNLIDKSLLSRKDADKLKTLLSMHAVENCIA